MFLHYANKLYCKKSPPGPSLIWLWSVTEMTLSAENNRSADNCHICRTIMILPIDRNYPVLQIQFLPNIRPNNGRNIRQKHYTVVHCFMVCWHWSYRTTWVNLLPHSHFTFIGFCDYIGYCDYLPLPHGTWGVTVSDNRRKANWERRTHFEQDVPVNAVSQLIGLLNSFMPLFQKIPHRWSSPWPPLAQEPGAAPATAAGCFTTYPCRTPCSYSSSCLCSTVAVRASGNLWTVHMISPLYRV